MAVDYMVRDRIGLRDLWAQIDHLHLNYLQADESPRKIDERKRLEGKQLRPMLYRLLNTRVGFLALQQYLE